MVHASLWAAACATVATARDPESVYFKVDEKGYVPASTWSSRLVTHEHLASRASPTMVQVSIPGLGDVAGDVAGGAEYFLGMPFAEPPVGKLRFMPAVAVTPWQGAINATQFCPTPESSYALTARRTKQPQIPNDAKLYNDEDILCVNLWRPAGTTGDAQLPIMVFIFGGGMVGGSSSLSWYDGKNLAQYHNRIMVTLNYRVGPLGFFSSPELSSLTGTPATGGANGLMDQNMALKWVKQYASAFGGDTESIGIFGESAGSLSVCTHLVSPLSAGLFNYAVLESGDCNGPWGPGDKQDGLNFSKTYMKKKGCETVACMQNLSVDQLSAWYMYYYYNDESDWKLTDFLYETPGYWVDGYYLPKQPYELFKTGTINSKAVLMGTNSMDGMVTYDYQYPQIPNYSSYATGMAKHWDPYGRYPNAPAAITAQYPANNRAISNVSDAYWQFTLADRDYNLYCSAYWLANVLQSRGIGAYRYKFSVGPRLYDQACIGGMVPCCQKDGVECYGWSSHGSEIPFAFNTTGNACDEGDACSSLTDPFTGSQPTVVRAMNEYWTSFLAAGVPTAAGFPTWQQSQHGLLHFETPTPTWQAESVDCEFWATYLPGQTRDIVA